ARVDGSDIAFDEAKPGPFARRQRFQRLRQVVARPRRKIVERDYVLAPSKQLLGQVRTDEASGPGHEEVARSRGQPLTKFLEATHVTSSSIECRGEPRASRLRP